MFQFHFRNFSHIPLICTACLEVRHYITTGEHEHRNIQYHESLLSISDPVSLSEILPGRQLQALKKGEDRAMKEQIGQIGLRATVYLH